MTTATTPGRATLSKREPAQPDESQVRIIDSVSITEQGADNVESLADDPRFAPRQDDLRSLATAIREGEHEISSPWASVSLFSAFPPSSTVAVPHSSKREAVLGVLAGVTVFLPVAWTWWSLKSATESYNEMISAGTAAGSSFLELWSTGFDGQLAVIHQLAPMAFISFILILVSVAVIVWHRIELNRAVAREHRETAAAEAELVAGLTLAQRALMSRNVEDPAQVAALVESSLARLSAAHKASKESAEALRQAVEETGETMRTASRESAENLVRGTHESSESMVQASGAARRDLEETSRSAAAAAAHTRSLLEGMVESTGQTMSESSSAVVGALDAFARTEKALDSSSVRLVAAVEAVGSEGKDAMQEFRNDFRKVSQELESIQNVYGQELNMTVDAVRHVQAQLMNMQQGAKEQVDELTRTREAIQYAASDFSKSTAAMERLSNGRPR